MVRKHSFDDVKAKLSSGNFEIPSIIYHLWMDMTDRQ